jgi:hypothetical protein
MVDNRSLRLGLVLVVAAGLLTGCNRNRSVVVDTPAPNPPVVTTPGQVTETAPQPAPDATADPSGTLTEPSKEPGASTAPGTASKPSPNTAQPPVKITEPGTAGWRATNITLEDLGKRIDKALKGLKDTHAQTVLTMEETRGSGRGQNDVWIKDNQTFRLQFTQLSEGAPATVEVVSNSGKRQMVNSSREESWQKLPNDAFPATAPKPDQVVRSWPSNFSKLVFAGLATEKDIWTPLTQGLAAGAEGYKAQIEERDLPYQGRNVKMYRILAKKGPSGQPGSTAIEIVVEADRSLPVTMRVNNTKENGQHFSYHWSCRYRFLQRPDPSLFAL